MHCGKCGMAFYCSKACQKRNWKRIHKRVCTEDPLLRQFIPVEMAIERALAKQPKVQKAPKDATCYICLEGEDGGKLMRGCACRGTSAGFVHLECLTEFATSKDCRDGWVQCTNCKQDFTGALDLFMLRRFWRRYRSDTHQEPRYDSTKFLAHCLKTNDESDAANRLFNALTYVGNDQGIHLDMKLRRSTMLMENGQKAEALELLQATLPEAKTYTDVHPTYYYDALVNTSRVLYDLDRKQESHDMDAELLAFAEEKWGPEGSGTLKARIAYARSCHLLGRDDESNAIFDDVIALSTRVLGRDHPTTKDAVYYALISGFAVCGTYLFNDDDHDTDGV